MEAGANRVGTKVGHILLEALLGSGGMGEVYRGFDQRLERRVAVKTIHDRHRLSTEMKARFLREARLLSRLEHAGICQIYDLLEGEDTDYLILEYVEGETLEAALKRDPGDAEKLRLALLVVDALSAAHRESIVHRDVKPENIMVTPGGGIKMLDFGIARTAQEAVATAPELLAPEGSQRSTAGEPDEVTSIRTEFLTGPRHPAGPPGSVLSDSVTHITQHGLVIGTVRYMSPEQALGQSVTPASDMYSFGILLQEMFTGSPAYPEGSPLQLLGWVGRAETLPVNGVDPDLTALIEDLKQLDLHRRPNAEETARRLSWLQAKPERLRRRRRLIVANAAAFLFLLVTLAIVTWLAVQAIEARQAAERHRGQAEGLIGFMLGDLYPKLETLGRLDVLDDVADRAIRYFDAVPARDLTDADMLQRAQVLAKIGEVRMGQGDLTAAMAAFQRARVMAQDLVKRHPDNRDWRYELGEIEGWVGIVLFHQGELDGAEETFRTYLSGAQDLLNGGPAKPKWQLQLAQAHNNLGNVYEARGDLEAALAAYREALTVNQRLADQEPENPTWQLEVGSRLNSLGNVLEARGDLEGAFDAYQRDLAIKQRLADQEPDNQLWQQNLGLCHNFLGRLLATRGDHAAAVEHFRADLAIAEALAARDPGNAQWQHGLAISRSRLALSLVRSGGASEGLRLLRSALEILQTLVTKDPTNLEWQVKQANCHYQVAVALEVLGRTAEARQEVGAALALFEPLATGATPDREARWRAAWALVLSGRLAAGDGDRAAATASWQRVLDLLAPVAATSRDKNVLEPWASALLLLGRTEQARPALQTLTALGSRSPELAQLAQARGIR